MTDQSLENLIRQLNSGNQENIILKQLTDNVYLAVVWDLPAGALTTLGIEYPHRFYFVKNETDQFVAAVFDMIQDLHWFTLPEYRGKGYLSGALRQTILDHLICCHQRSEQRITISKELLDSVNFEASGRLAGSVGFVKQGENEFEVIHLYKPANSIEFEEPDYKGLSEEQLQVIQQKINVAANIIARVNTELELAYGQEPEVKSVEKLSKKVYSEMFRIEDFWDKKQ
ncbi:hypothetical protein [Microscilla marina]|uniref:Uncharacterized protein n=1 Tax=Microscilla marina ATCC 23134 TaxID=313606 RepID=A1ZET1_MICM2|nr:hypothetical protein [Microscilla marina]EAY31033.1 hypothetical protein M23134_07440 [Microscilla marina ATCC 23134]